MEEIEGFRYRCRVSLLRSVKMNSCHISVQKSTNCNVKCFQLAVCLDLILKFILDDESFCLHVGCHAFGDQASSEGGQTERDQAGAAHIRKAQGEGWLLVHREKWR